MPYLQTAMDQAPDGGLNLALLALAEAELGRFDAAATHADRAVQHAVG